jgi:hypothetical protein
VPRIAGWTFAAVSASVAKSFSDLAARYPGAVSGVTMRAYSRAGRDGGVLVLLGLSTAVIGDEVAEQRVVSGTLAGLGGAGARTTQPVVAGQSVTMARTSATCVAGWYRKGVVTLVIGGASSEPVTALAAALVRAT